MDNLYHLVLWFYPDADPCGEILTDAYSVTSSQFKLCSEVTPNLTVDFAMIRERVRDGNNTLVHQLGEFMAADGMTKSTTVANKVLMNFLHTNRLGTHGVEMPQIEAGVKKRLNRAYAAKNIHPNNISAPYLENLARSVHVGFTGDPGSVQYDYPTHFSFMAQDGDYDFECNRHSRHYSDSLGPKDAPWKKKRTTVVTGLKVSNHPHGATPRRKSCTGDIVVDVE
jgi:hypothetical protein